MDLFEQVSKDIMAAMKARDKVRANTLRNIKKVFLEAKTAPGAHDELSEEEALKIVAKLAKQGRDSMEQFRNAGREDLAKEEEEQAKIIEEYLPKQLTKEEIEVEVKKIVDEVGAVSMKDMGKVMGTASKRLAGRADGKTISAVVKGLLG